jgi:predicted membrane-bound spermidine synthase
MLKTENAVLLALVFISSFAGMLSQLLVGYLIGIQTGGLYKQYSITFGLFVFFMGLGAARKVKNDFYFVLAGQVASPIFLTLIWILCAFDLPYFGFALLAPLGYFAGAELPLVIRMYSAREADYDQVLFLDYLAMSIATLAFALIIFPALGVPGTFALVMVGNVSMAAILFGSRRRLEPR